MLTAFARCLRPYYAIPVVPASRRMLSAYAFSSPEVALSAYAPFGTDAAYDATRGVEEAVARLGQVAYAPTRTLLLTFSTA